MGGSSRVCLLTAPLVLAWLSHRMLTSGPTEASFTEAQERLRSSSITVSNDRVVEGKLSEARREEWYKFTRENLTFQQYPASECHVFNSTPDNKTWVDIKHEKLEHPSLLGKISNLIWGYVLEGTALKYTLASVVLFDDHAQEQARAFAEYPPEFMEATRELSYSEESVVVPTWVGNFAACQSLAKVNANVIIGRHYDGPYLGHLPHKTICNMKIARQMTSNFILVGTLLYAGIVDDLYIDRVLCTLYLRSPPSPEAGTSDKSVIWVNGTMKTYNQENGSYICYNSGRIQHTGGEGKVSREDVEAAAKLELEAPAGEEPFSVSGCRILWRWSAMVLRSRAEEAALQAPGAGITEELLVSRIRQLLLRESLLASAQELDDDQVWLLLGIRNLACAPDLFMLGYVRRQRFWGTRLCKPILLLTKAFLWSEWQWRGLWGLQDPPQATVLNHTRPSSTDL